MWRPHEKKKKIIPGILYKIPGKILDFCECRKVETLLTTHAEKKGK